VLTRQFKTAILECNVDADLSAISDEALLADLTDECRDAGDVAGKLHRCSKCRSPPVSAERHCWGTNSLVRNSPRSETPEVKKSAQLTRGDRFTDLT
jgi:hypothetical protein